MPPPASDDPARLLRAIFADALLAVAPAGPTAAALGRLDLAPSIVLLALGKAALGMAAGAHAALGDRIRAQVVVAPEGAGGPRGVAHLVAAHPVPDARSEAAGRALLAAAARARADEDVVALVSGGGSALAAVPAGGLGLADKVATTSAIQASGAPIGALNCVRRHLSAIKGGRLARASRARVTTLVISDVVGDDLAAVASGPTVADPTSAAEACAVVERWVGWAAIAPAARAHLEAGRRAGRRDADAPLRPRDRALLLLGLDAAVGAALAAAAARGVAAAPMATRLEGDVERAAAALLGGLAAGGPRLLVGGGETTVTLPARHGTGGRAHQLALLLARGLRGRRGVTALVAGTDGVDGNSAAAGAVVDGGTWDAIAARGVDPAAALAACDAAPALAAVAAEVATGPTGVNHADLIMILRST